MPGKKITAPEIYALAFGLFLGLTIWKFGNPVILDQKIIPPASPADFWNDAWPVHWARWIFWPLAMVGAIFAFSKNPRWPAAKWLWRLPLTWFGWQVFSASQSEYADLTAPTLWQYAGCVAGYFLGAFLFRDRRALNFLLAGILAAFTFCLVRAVDQRLFEFPQSLQMLVESERAGWTNMPPEMLLEMKREQVVVTTNGVDVANPVILAKFAKGRVMGTLVYPNALAGAILLLFPVSLAVAFGATKKLKPAIRLAVIALAIFLGGAAFFWTGSKLGWLIALGTVGIFLLRLGWPKKLKLAAIAAVLIFGLGIFAVRFHNYFATGATSVGARFDYWRAAWQTTAANPVAGSGPGTFQRPYAKLKSPGAEMARLAHNDYLEQFSDSGVVGGLAYAIWIVSALMIVGRHTWKSGDTLAWAVFAGLLGWFVQGLGEFGLFIPALAFTAFTLLGAQIGINSTKNGQTASLKRQ
jgi:hypothetical protein